MRVTIHLKTDSIDFGELGKLPITEVIMNMPLKAALKKVGWKKLWRIRRIHRCKPFKCKWTAEALEGLKMSCNVDVEKVLMKMMREELDTHRLQKDLEYIERHKNKVVLNEKVTIDNPDELHCRKDRIY